MTLLAWRRMVARIATCNGLRTLAALWVAIVAAVVAAPADAAPVNFTGGHVDWGVKQSFREYIEANPADGAVRVSGGAYRTATGEIRFPVGYAAGGSYDAATDAGEIRLRGNVRFIRHQTAPGSGLYALDMTIAALRLVIDGDAGSLIADVTAKDIASGSVDEFDDLEVGAVDLAAAGPTAGIERFTWASSGATLTAEGAPVFGGFYGPGDALDPVSATATYGTPSLPPAAPTLTTDPPSPADQNAPRVRVTAPADTTVRLYRGPECSGAPIASGPAADFGGAGFSVAVADNSTTAFTALALTEDGASDCSAALLYSEVTPKGGGGDTDPPAGPPPAASPFASVPRLKGPRAVGRGGKVAIGRIRCLRGPCRVTAPKRTRVRIAKNSFWAAVVAPRRIATGRSAYLRLTLPPKALKKLAGRRGKVTVRIAVVSDGQRKPFVVKSTLKRR